MSDPLFSVNERVIVLNRHGTKSFEATVLSCAWAEPRDGYEINNPTKKFSSGSWTYTTDGDPSGFARIGGRWLEMSLRKLPPGEEDEAWKKFKSKLPEEIFAPAIPIKEREEA